MRKILSVSVLAMTAASVLAVVPRVDENTVEISQDQSRLLTVSYVLTGGPGVVTVDFQTNCVTASGTVWASIGAENFLNLDGDVNRIVKETGVRKSFIWRPDLSWTGHKIKDGFRAVVKAWALDDPPDYAVLDLTTDGAAAFYATASAVPGGVTHELYKTDCLLLRRIHAANVVWRMGSPLGEIGKNYDDKNNIRETPRLVMLTNDYYMAVYETTCQQNKLIRKSSTSYSGDARLKPMVGLSWNEIRAETGTSGGESGGNYDWPTKGHAVGNAGVMGKLRSRWPVIAGFDLPTEAQWEFACRGGCGAALYNNTELTGNDGSASGAVIDAIGWCKGYASTAQIVGQKVPNAYGLYDMIGNVEEWCLDWWEQQGATGVETIVPGKVYIDPPGPTATSSGVRAIRGGSYVCNTANVRCAARSLRSSPSTGGLTSVGYRICARAELVSAE